MQSVFAYPIQSIFLVISSSSMRHIVHPCSRKPLYPLHTVGLGRER